MKLPSMVVFVGPECAGKSTQIQMFAEEFSAKVVKHVRIPDRFQMLASVVDDIKQHALRTSVGAGESLVVFDRWQLVDDILYEKYCYGKDSILEPLLPILSEACRELDIVIVYLNISEEEMIKRFNIRGDKLRTLDEAIRVRNAYEEFFSHCILPYEKIEVDGLSTEALFQMIIDKTGIEV